MLLLTTSATFVSVSAAVAVFDLFISTSEAPIVSLSLVSVLFFPVRLTPTGVISVVADWLLMSFDAAASTLPELRKSKPKEFFGVGSY